MKLAGPHPVNVFILGGIVLFDLLEGNKYTKSKQFLREARIALAEAGSIQRSLLDTPELKQQSEEGSSLSIGFDWKHSGQVCCYLPTM